MLLQSYVIPVGSVTGSFIRSNDMGHQKGMGTATSVLRLAASMHALLLPAGQPAPRLPQGKTIVVVVLRRQADREKRFGFSRERMRLCFVFCVFVFVSWFAERKKGGIERAFIREFGRGSSGKENEPIKRGVKTSGGGGERRQAGSFKMMGEISWKVMNTDVVPLNVDR
ncbi:hypothetical protein NL676_008306 [Syzygium grande]|nr:hypothetical protein NL676_008306 [Syzygium grande]